MCEESWAVSTFKTKEFSVAIDFKPNQPSLEVCTRGASTSGTTATEQTSCLVSFVAWCFMTGVWANVVMPFLVWLGARLVPILWLNWLCGASYFLCFTDSHGSPHSGWPLYKKTTKTEVLMRHFLWASALTCYRHLELQTSDISFRCLLAAYKSRCGRIEHNVLFFSPSSISAGEAAGSVWVQS